MALCLASSLADAQTLEYQYQYDAAGRLVQADIGPQSITYGYDANGNLLTRTVPEPSRDLLMLAAWASVWLLWRRSRRRGTLRAARRVRVAPLVGLALAATSLSAESAGAHTFDTTTVLIRGIGNTGQFTILDNTGCSAEITTFSFNQLVASVQSPTGVVHAVTQVYTVIANTEFGSTSILVSWTGEGTNSQGDPCLDVASQSIEITVRKPFQSAGGNASSATYPEDPVDASNGELYFHEPVDLYLGGPMPLYFSRFYAAFLGNDGGVNGGLGPNWSHGFDWTLNYYGNLVEIVDPQGRMIRFIDSDTTPGGVNWVLDGDTSTPFELVEDPSVAFRLGEPETQRIYRFAYPNFGETLATFASIEDGHGNTHTVTLTNDLPTQVSDGLGRTLTLNYSGGELTSVSDATRTVSFVHSGGYLSTVTDARGNTTTYNYDAGAIPGLLANETRPEGNSPLSQTFDAQGRVVTQTDADSNTTSLDYAGASTTGTDPFTEERVMTHDAEGRLTELVDEEGVSVTLSYDGEGRRSGIVDRLGDDSSVAFDGTSGRVSVITNADATQTTITYTARSVAGLTFYDRTGVGHPDGTSESFVYDSSGNLTTYTDRASNNTVYSYNSRGQALTVTNPGGGVDTYTYNSDGTLATHTDPATNQTQYAYDGLRRLATITRPDSSIRTFAYDANDNLSSITNERNETLTLDYDMNNNLLVITDPLMETQTMTYDGMDRVLTATDPQGRVESRSYDALQRVATVTAPSTHVTTYGYDTRGRLSSITDGATNTWSRSHDAEGALLTSTDPLSKTTTYASDQMGRITRVTTPEGNETLFGYDEMGLATSVRAPNLEITNFGYDERGLLQSHTLAGEGISASYTRDALGGITSIMDPNGQIWLSSYDSSGRATSSTDPLGNGWSYSYDNRNRVSQVAYTGGATLDLSYNALGEVTNKSYSGGLEISFSYDELNRMVTGDDIALGYDSAGSLNLSNGLMLMYDANARVSELLLAPGKDVDYSYNSVDLVSQVTDWLGGTTTFAYDAAGQLTTITRPNGVNTTLSYDDDGRIVGIVEGVLSTTTIVRNLKGQVQSAARQGPQPGPSSASGVEALTYDAASQVESFSYDTRGRLSTDPRRTYTWDPASRLTSYEEGGTTVSFGYDALGRRISRTESGVTRQYVWNDSVVLPVVNIVSEAASDLAYYITTPTGLLLYRIDAVSNERLDYHYDGAGNTVFLTNLGGAVEAAYTYDPYGELLASTGSVDQPFKWQGRFGVMQEGSSGLYYARARYFDSAQGARFISRDPLPTLNPLSINPYQYAFANPIGYTDPDGLDPREIGPYETAARSRISAARRAAEEARRASEEEARRRQDEQNEEGTRVREQRIRESREAATEKLRTRTRNPQPTPDPGDQGSSGGGGTDDDDDDDGPRDVGPSTCPVVRPPRGTRPPKSSPDPTLEAAKAGGVSVVTNFAGGPIPIDVLRAQEQGTRLVIDLCERKSREEALLGVRERRELRQGETYWGDIARSAGEYTIVQFFLLPFE